MHLVKISLFALNSEGVNEEVIVKKRPHSIWPNAKIIFRVHTIQTR
jgi:hypothetical protein